MTRWRFEGDDDNLTEYWHDLETGRMVEVRRDGPPLYTIAAEDIPNQPIYGPPKDA